MTLLTSRPSVRTRERLYTAADLAAMPSEVPSGTVLHELDNGRLVSLPPHDERHAAVLSEIAAALHRQGAELGLGRARCGGSGLVLWRNPDRVVGADAAFIA